jgi:hypothetical protein
MIRSFDCLQAIQKFLRLFVSFPVVVLPAHTIVASLLHGHLLVVGAGNYDISNLCLLPLHMFRKS